MYSFRHSYGCSCGRYQSYGTRFFVFDNEGSRSTTRQRDPISPQSDVLSPKDPTPLIDATNTQTDLSRDDVIHGLKAALHEAGKIPNGAPETGDNIIQSMLTLIQKLQDDKEQLQTKLLETQSCASHLQQENQRLVKHIEEEMVGLEDNSPQQAKSDCSTDTEKVLDKFKRQFTFLNHEVKILRDENIRLRQLDGIKEFGNDENENRLKQLKNEMRETTDEMITSFKNTIGIEIASLGKRNESFEAESITHKATNEGNDGKKPIEIWKDERENKDAEIQLSREKISKLHNGIMNIQESVYDLHQSYETLNKETGRSCSRMKDTMMGTVQEIQHALVAINLQNEKLKQKYIREMKLRKTLQNQLVELKGNIRVYCRVRPCLKEDSEGDDSETGMKLVVSPDPLDDGLVSVDSKGRSVEFDVDRVFGMESSQEEVFEEVSPLVRSALDGFNVCIFAYGQTGSGKTYTMEGQPTNPGINQRALRLLFEDVSQDGWTYEISASVLEIYNETIRDLLNPDPSNKLEVKLKPEGGLHVPGLMEVSVSSLEEMNVVFETGRRNRFIAATSMNDVSSRSHCLLCVTVNGYNKDTGLRTSGRLNLIDLAGSERLARSHADGVRLKEAQNINRSLACLGDVIHALRSKQGHIPYRNSKLTYLLQDSLGGDSKTLMIVQVSPVDKNVSETVCTLNFGQRVRSVEIGAATKNVSGSKTCNTNGKPPSQLNLNNMMPSTSISQHPTSPVSSSAAATSPAGSSTRPSSLSPLFKKYPYPVSSPCSSPTSNLTRQNSRRSPISTEKSFLSRSVSFTHQSSKRSSQNYESNPRNRQTYTPPPDSSQQDFHSSYPPAGKTPPPRITVQTSKTTTTPSTSKHRSSNSNTPSSAVVQQKIHKSSKTSSQINDARPKTSSIHQVTSTSSSSSQADHERMPPANMSISQTSTQSSTPSPK